MLKSNFVAQIVKTKSNNIRYNQLGFLPNMPKIVVIKDKPATTYKIYDEKENVVFDGEFVRSAKLGFDGKPTYIADFSSFKGLGTFTLFAKGLGFSSPFKIEPTVFSSIAKAAIKAFYFQRASTALPKEYAGKWFRDAGHPDQMVVVHQSAASENRPVGTIISAPGGWYDAGDYNKYMVNSGVTMGTLLSLYEDFPDYIKKLMLQIPESKNAIPDELDEVLYNLRWMLCMQDVADGGVYNKLTNANFDGLVMPSVTKAPRYVVQKGTAATLNFAAVMAQSSRIFKQFDARLPGLSDSCLNAAEKAWRWALKNPKVIYNQEENNRKFSPKITTGGYGDTMFDDEFSWAACELYITTHDENYCSSIGFKERKISLPSWKNVKTLGFYSLLRNKNSLGKVANSKVENIEKWLTAFADSLVAGLSDRPYQTIIGKTAKDFGWGSNATAANQGVLMIMVYRITGDKKYLDFALHNLDYLLGRNATGYAYVTGFGTKSPLFPHHRQSAADGVDAPIPGLLVGGPNAGRQDGLPLKSIIPDEAYTDETAAYSSNEIAINWNAPFAYLINAINALQPHHKFKIN